MPFNPFKMFDRKHKVVQNSQYLSFLLVKAQVNDNFFFTVSLLLAVWSTHSLLGCCCFFFSTMKFWPINFPPFGYFVFCFFCLKRVIVKPKD